MLLCIFLHIEVMVKKDSELLHVINDVFGINRYLYPFGKNYPYLHKKKSNKLIKSSKRSNFPTLKN